MAFRQCGHEGAFASWSSARTVSRNGCRHMGVHRYASCDVCCAVKRQRGPNPLPDYDPTDIKFDD